MFKELAGKASALLNASGICSNNCMLNKEFCISLEELVDELAQPMSTADIAELTIQLQIGKVIKD